MHVMKHWAASLEEKEKKTTTKIEKKNNKPTDIINYNFRL